MPVEPEKSTAKPVSSMIVGALICGIIGMLAGLFIMIFTDTIALIISSLAGLAIGALLGLLVANSQKKSDLASYSQRCEDYQKELAEYNAHQESLKQRTASYEPIIEEENFQKAFVIRDDELAEDEWVGLLRM